MQWRGRKHLSTFQVFQRCLSAGLACYFPLPSWVMGCWACRPSVHLRRAHLWLAAAQTSSTMPLRSHQTILPFIKLECLPLSRPVSLLPAGMLWLQRSGSWGSSFSILFIYNLQMQSISEYIPSVKHSCIKNRAGEIAWPVNHWLSKHEDLQADPQHSVVSSLGR